MHRSQTKKEPTKQKHFMLIRLSVLCSLVGDDGQSINRKVRVPAAYINKYI